MLTVPVWQNTDVQPGHKAAPHVQRVPERAVRHEGVLRVQHCRGEGGDEWGVGASWALQARRPSNMEREPALATGPYLLQLHRPFSGKYRRCTPL